MQRLKVWDPVVRVFHWSLVAGFAANALVLDDDGKLHQWVGYIVVALVILRLIWGVVGTRFARFSSFPPDISASLGQMRDILNGIRRIHIGHTPLGALMIYNLLLSMLVIGVSGWLMTTDMFWGVEWPEELHETAVAWAEVSVVLHVAAVLFESWRTSVNLPRAMITGCKEIQKDQEMVA
ncbi:cytochrome b/b6 domain-containing protein [Ovoidimarina sediminis]|uniref:cytochrome b/b6 domain-containing protein n=1 Tax=Ovoidimarina sediminis TaxID=3079856 RepID=UPI00290A2AEC|nr:cytochrome b/b6 domain-containing protein [Rhodophyticola sp. MJ-SS7]MDU8943375.1 cytochrome b/b6 domain-containing protein [Rhodophyticola sp. MJ-SS7]